MLQRRALQKQSNQSQLQDERRRVRTLVYLDRHRGYAVGRVRLRGQLAECENHQTEHVAETGGVRLRGSHVHLRTRRPEFIDREGCTENNKRRVRGRADAIRDGVEATCDATASRGGTVAVFYRLQQMVT